MSYNYRVYNEQNWSEVCNHYLATYFRTKKEAVEFAKTLKDAVLERRAGASCSWQPCSYEK